MGLAAHTGCFAALEGPGTRAGAFLSVDNLHFLEAGRNTSDLRERDYSPAFIMR